MHADAHNLFFKGSVSNLNLKFSVPKQHLACQGACNFPRAGLMNSQILSFWHTWKVLSLTKIADSAEEPHMESDQLLARPNVV